MKFLKNLRQLFFYCCCCCQYRKFKEQPNSAEEKFSSSESSTTTSSTASENQTKAKQNASLKQKILKRFSNNNRNVKRNYAKNRHLYWNESQFSNDNCLWQCFPKFICNSRRSKLAAANLPSIKLLLIGLDNVGKTTLARYLAGESINEVVPTIGFSRYKINLKNFSRYNIILYDVGGGRPIRAIWKNYYSLVHGIIFVIDASDLERIAVVRELIQNVVSNNSVAGKPILIFLNKQDLQNTMDEIDVCKYTNLESLMAQYRCLTKLVPISAKRSADQELDQENFHSETDFSKGIISGLRWIVGYIDNQWSELNGLVQYESEKQISEENEKMQQRIDNRKKQAENAELNKINAQTIDTNQPQTLCHDCNEQNLDATINSIITNPLEQSTESLEKEKQFQLKPNNKIHPSN